MKKFLAVPALLFASTAFAAPNLTGTWTVHNVIAGNESDQECKLVLTDNKISGTCKSQEDKDLPVTGSLDGTPLTLVYTATLDDSGKIAGTLEVQPFNVSGEFTATPKEAAK